MKIAQLQKVRDELFDQELDEMEARQRAPRGRRRDFTPIMDFDNQDEVDSQVAQDLKDMQKEFFGKPGGMGTGKHEKPWVKDQLDPFRDREPTKDELEEIERNALPDSQLGITEKELTDILNQEQGMEMPDDFTDEDAEALMEEDDGIDWNFRHNLGKPKPEVKPEEVLPQAPVHHPKRRTEY